MAHLPLDSALMIRALELLDERLEKHTRLVIGGGAAMALAYEHPMATQVVDAFTAKGSTSMAELDEAAKVTARELDIEPEWLNPHFETYTGVLSGDYAQRLRRIFDGAHLVADALGPEDLLLMKCFAGRDEDVAHARRLAQRDDIDLDLVDEHLSKLVERGYPRAERAADYFDDLRDELGR